jgi:hypothetical protein
VSRYEKEEKMNKWEEVKRYVNSKEIGTVITRKDLMNLIYNGPHPPTSSYGTTVDNYRRCLVLLGILDHTNIGEYTLRYRMREDLTVAELRSLAYGGYRSWFNDVKITERGERENI